MDFLQYTAGTDDEGRRLDRVLRIFLKDLSMSEIYKLIRTKMIRVNGKKTDCNYRVKKNDEIRLPRFSDSLFEKKEKESKISKERIEEIFINDFVKIVNKPYGMTVHGAGEKENLEQIVRSQFRPKEQSLSFRPGPLQRIDRHTTGLVVFSQSHKGALVFSELLRAHLIKKEYLAILCGELKEVACWEDSLAADKFPSDKEGFHTVKITSGEGKKARTKVSPVSHGVYEGLPVTLALIQIETGRKHQIRCQCAEHGYPLLGDTAYGGKNPESIKGHFMLHAWRMTFPSDSGIDLPSAVTAPIPEKMLNFIKNYLSHDELSNYNILRI